MPLAKAHAVASHEALQALESVPQEKLASHMFMLETIVRKVNTQMTLGMAEPTISDGLKAAELIARGNPANPITDAFVAMFMKVSA